MRQNHEEPGFVVVLSNWIVTGICGLYGFVYGLAFLGSVYSTVVFHLGWSTEYVPPWLIFISLALTGLYGASVSELRRWTQAGGFFGLIANSVSLLMVFTELVSAPISGQIIESPYATVLPSIAIILILLCWNYLYTEKPSSSKEP